MAFESLTDRLAGVFKKLRGHGKLSEADIKAAMREVRMALLEADVNYKVAKDFCAKVSERAMGQEVMESLTPAQQVVKIVNEELVALMGGEEAPRLVIKNKGQTIIMLCGLQGNGKPPTPQSWQSTLSNRAAAPCWWPAIFTALRPSISCRWWANRRAHRCSRCRAQSRRKLQRRRWHTPRITAMIS